MAHWLIQVAVGRRVEKEDGSKRLWVLSQLEKLGRLLVSTPPPWAIRTAEGMQLEWLFQTRQGEDPKPYGPWDGSPDAFFGLLIAFAVALEKEFVTQKRHRITWLRDRNLGLLTSFRDILLLRFAKERALAQDVLAHVTHEMVNAGFGEKQQALLIGWARKELHFVGHEMEEGSELKQ